jgi:hypothetical protein
MKQHITKDDLNKLSDEHKERLREWWNPQKWDIAVWGESEFPVSKLEADRIVDAVEENSYVVNEYGHDDSYPLNQCIPLLSIGQMIQFIEENKPLLKGISKNRFNQWFVNIENGMLGYKDELCDALWEATKQLLKG